MASSASVGDFVETPHPSNHFARFLVLIQCPFKLLHEAQVDVI